MVNWGLKPGTSSTQQQAPSSTSTYTAEDLCNTPANSTGWASPGVIHTAIMTALQPGTRYYYSVGGAFGYSEEYSFLTSPSPDQTLHVLAWADHGAYNPDNARWVCMQWFMNPNARAVYLLGWHG